MTTTSVYASTWYTFGYDQPFSGTYASARTMEPGVPGGVPTDSTPSWGHVGQVYNSYFSAYSCMETAHRFATTGLPDTDLPSAATLYLYGQSDSSTTNFTIYAGPTSFGLNADGYDAVPAADIANIQDCASYTLGSWSTSGYNTFTSGATFPGLIDPQKDLELIIWSSRHEGNNTPTGDEYVFYYAGAYTGTTRDPYISVVHAADSVVKKASGLAPAKVRKIAGVTATTVKKIAGQRLLGVQPAYPRLVGIGTAVGGAAAQSPAWPTHEAGDLGVLITTARSDDAAISLSDAQGFSQVSGSPNPGYAATSSYVQIAVFTCIATSAAMSAPTIADGGDHQRGLIVVLRGATGVVDAYAESNSGSGTIETPHNFAGITTTVNNAYVIGIICTNTNNLFYTSFWKVTEASDNDLILDSDTYRMYIGGARKPTAGSLVGVTNVASGATSSSSTSIAFR